MAARVMMPLCQTATANSDRTRRNRFSTNVTYIVSAALPSAKNTASLASAKAEGNSPREITIAATMLSWEWLPVLAVISTMIPAVTTAPHNPIRIRLRYCVSEPSPSRDISRTSNVVSPRDFRLSPSMKSVIRNVYCPRLAAPPMRAIEITSATFSTGTSRRATRTAIAFAGSDCFAARAFANTLMQSPLKASEHLRENQKCFYGNDDPAKPKPEASSDVRHHAPSRNDPEYLRRQ